MQRVKDEHLARRREYLYSLNTIPAAQIGNPLIDFGVIEVQPASGNKAEQYLQLVNISGSSVDVSGWKLTEAVDYTLPMGTVIPAGWTLYVVADKNAFRLGPRGPAAGKACFWWVAGKESCLPKANH